MNGNEKVLSLLGLAAKAGSLSYGAEATKAALCSGKANAAVVCSEISDKSLKEIRFFAAKRNIPVILLQKYDINTVSSAVGRKCGILSVNNSSFAGAVLAAVQTGGNANE